MTRRNLKAKLTYTFVFLGAVLLLAAVARFSAPLAESGSLGAIAWQATYDYLKDMSLLIATGGVAYLTNVYQKRSSFIDSLKEEWRDVLHAKSALLEFTHIDQPTSQQYVATFNVLSETIDNMRTVYRNVGETKDLVGLYPFAPLHDMRRFLQTLNPTKVQDVTEEQRKQVRDAILQAFYALREVFLEELDLEEPSRPLLIFGGRRTKQSGATRAARSWQDRQAKRHAKVTTPDAAIDALHKELYDREQSTPKVWRELPPTPGKA
jgi:hypothetical protein